MIGNPTFILLLQNETGFRIEILTVRNYILWWKERILNLYRYYLNYNLFHWFDGLVR